MKPADEKRLTTHSQGHKRGAKLTFCIRACEDGRAYDPDGALLVELKVHWAHWLHTYAGGPKPSSPVPGRPTKEKPDVIVRAVDAMDKLRKINAAGVQPSSPPMATADAA